MENSPTLFLFSIVALILGVFIGGAFMKATGGGYDKGYADAWEKAEARAIEVGLIPETPFTVTILTGTVEEVQKDAVVITTTLQEINPFADPLPGTRRVQVTKDTTIAESVPLDPEDIQKAQDAFLKKLETLKPGAEPLIPPEPIALKTIALDVLRVGDVVTVEAGEDIRTEEEFTATSVRR